MQEQKVDKFRNGLATWAGNFQKNIYMRAIGDAMVGMMPLMMVASIAALINAINIGGSQAFMQSIGLSGFLRQINTMTLSVISVYVAFLVSYKLGTALKHDPLVSGIMGLMSFLILTPISTGEGFNGIVFANLGSGAMFVAMLGGVLGVKSYTFLVGKNIMLKLPDTVPPQVGKAFSAILPGLITAALMGLIHLLASLTPQGSLLGLTQHFVQTPFSMLGENIVAAMILVAFMEVLWFFGIHGPITMMPIMMLLFQANQVANLEAFATGEALPFLFTTSFILFNRGARSFAVAIHCMLCKSIHLKTVGKLGFVPTLFGISEPVRFGIPQPMNMLQFVPTVITPAIALFSAWLLVQVGFLPFHNGVEIPLGTPIILSGLIAHGWQGIVAQLLQVVLVFIVYIPFMRAQDKIYVEQEFGTATADGTELA